MNRDPDATFRGRVNYIAFVALAAVASVFLFATAFDVVLMAFAGCLIASVLRGAADFLTEHTPLSIRPAIAVICVLNVAGAVLTVAVFFPMARDEFAHLGTQFPSALETLEGWLHLPTLGEQAQELLSNESGGGMAIASGIQAVLQSSLAAFVAVVVALFVGLFVAIEPELYANMVTKAVGPERAERSTALLARCASALRWWAVGSATSMAMVGVLSAVGLAIIGVPSPIALGLLAALLAFIPNVGPILSVVPAALLVASDGIGKVVAVMVLYIVIQTVESYVITPQVQKRATSIPPALLLLGQLVFALYAGIAGLMLAAPLLAVGVVIAGHLIQVRDENRRSPIHVPDDPSPVST